MISQYERSTEAVQTTYYSEYNAVNCVAPSIKFFGAYRQNGTPTPDNPINIEFNNVNYGNYITSGANYGDTQFFTIPNLRAIPIPDITWDDADFVDKWKKATGYIDEWDVQSGKGIRCVHEVKLDGKSSYKKAETYDVDTPGIAYCSISSEYALGESGSRGFKSTHFKALEDVTTVGNIWALETNNKSFTFTVDATKYPDLDSVNTWLAEQFENETPVTVYYAMAEPQEFVFASGIKPIAGRRITFFIERGEEVKVGACAKVEVTLIRHSHASAMLLSSDEYILKDANGLYVTAKGIE